MNSRGMHRSPRSSRNQGRERNGPAGHGVVAQELEGRRLLSAMLDPSFGSGGLTLTDYSGRADAGYAVAQTADGQVLVAGRVGNSSGSDFVVVRYDAAGVIDRTFGNNGYAVVNFGAVNEGALAMAVTGEGKIVLAGVTNSGVGRFFDFAVARLTAQGRVDTSFDVDGRATYDFAGSFDQAYAVAVQGDGSMLVAGTATVGGLFQFGMLKLLESGALDSSFGIGGRVTTDLRVGQSEAFAMVVRGDGKIVLGGYVYAEDATESNVALARYHANGALDASFGDGGIVVDDLGGYDDAVRAMMVSSRGLVVAGNSNEDFMVGRYLEEGSRDSGFADAGVFRADFAGGTDQAMAVAAVGERILAVGFADGKAGHDLGLLMLDGRGRADAGFAPEGESTLDLGSVEESAQAITAQADESVLVAGYVFNESSNNDIALARLLVVPPNEAPVAHAGETYHVGEGGEVVLAGTGSTDSDGTIVSYEWDFDYDGVNFDADAAGEVASFSAAGLDGPSERTVALRVTDDDGATHVATAVVSVSNVAPVVKLVMPPGAVRGQEVTFNGRIDDPGIGDTFAVTWDFGDGTVIRFTRDAAGLLSAAHTYMQAGVYAVTLTAVDDDGAMHSLTRTISVAAAGLQTDPLNPNQTVLLIGGTTGDDLIRIIGRGKQGVAVYINDRYLGLFNPNTRITVYGQGGEDRVIVSGSVKQPVEHASDRPKKNDKRK